ncbi:hypothetical protein D3C76_1600540 [compost metagenome]
MQGKEPTLPAVDSNEYTFGNPGDATDAAGWNTLLQGTTRLAQQLRDQLAALQESDLEAAYLDSEEKWAHELARWVLHDAYHAGQIVLLRRQQGSWNIVF